MSEPEIKVEGRDPTPDELRAMLGEASNKMMSAIAQVHPKYRELAIVTAASSLGALIGLSLAHADYEQTVAMCIKGLRDGCDLTLRQPVMQRKFQLDQLMPENARVV